MNSVLQKIAQFFTEWDGENESQTVSFTVPEVRDINATYQRASLWRRELDRIKLSKVMAIDEIWLRGDDEPLYLEYKAGVEKVLKPAIFQPDCSDDGRGDYYMCFVSAWRALGYYNGNEYGRTWRCWTSRPTDEQREAEEWNEETI